MPAAPGDNPTADHGPEGPDQSRPAPTSRATRAGRFAPGEVLAGRYRVVSFLGRGGMGEVYRAEDVRLDVEVALKFLSPELASDGAWLARLYAETRMAREVAHRHVCRVFDVGELQAEAGGGAFISMEYVDGEDLASLLRRIGRMPRDKAAQIARQLCAGLAAAHERGVAHRDLKPSNVMIDGRGDVKLTDFGIAARAASGEGGRSGTPLYMSPEQLRGEAATAASDVFALGLVLYEMYTGRRAFEERSAGPGSGTHVEPASSIDPEIDPAVERVIHRCMEEDPARRPAGALAVAAALPGGDPLRAALEAGETPSPELVAASGGSGALRPRTGLALLLLAGLLLFVGERLGSRTSLLAVAPPALTAEALEDRARQALRALGYTETPSDTAFVWDADPGYVRWVYGREGTGGRGRLRAAPDGAVRFLYRESPERFEPLGPMRRVGWNDPPSDGRGMRRLLLDAGGRLAWLRTTPPAVLVPRSESAAQVDWSAVFGLAGLDFARFNPVDERRVWHGDALESLSWTGPSDRLAGELVRVHAGVSDGRVTQFEVRFPWELDDLRRNAWTSDGPAGTSVAYKALGLLLVGLTGAAALVARRNLTSGKGDRSGALRVAFGVFAAMSASVLLSAHNFPTPMAFIASDAPPLALAAWLAVMIWTLYVAVEPIARRTWPTALASWARLLRGDWKDPLVGRDLLIGVCAGGAVGAAFGAARLIEQGDGPPLGTGNFVSLYGGARVLGQSVGSMAGQAMWAMGMLATLVLVTAAIPRRRVGVGIASSILVLFSLLNMDPRSPGSLAIALAAGVAQAVLLARVGLLALFACAVTLWLLRMGAGVEWSGWLRGAAWIPFAIVGAIALHGHAAATRPAPGRASVR